MSLGRLVLPFSSLGLLAIAGCGGGSGSSSSVTIESVVQDLGLDPDGMTTVVGFDGDPGALAAGDFQVDGGQTAQSVTLAGSDATVVWDDRVSPSHQVRVVGRDGIDESYVDVTTTDAAAPTFAVDSATQNAGLGDDEIVVAFSGANVIEDEAEDELNWTLTVDGEALDWTGSTFTFDANAQELTIVTGTLANLHADFTLSASGVHSVADVAVDGSDVIGAASGDNVAPTLVSAEQNLAEDEYGRVIDFTFSEAMDPVFCNVLSNFAGANPDVATSIDQPSEDVLRVTFNNPIVPGVNTIDLSGLLDAHGNDFADQTSAIDPGTLIANDFTSTPSLTTVSGTGGDYLTAEFDQAIDPDDAIEPTKWTLEIPVGVAYDLSTATLDYDLVAKTLTITLEHDFANGASFQFGPTVGDEPLDVDGEAFPWTMSDVIAGETSEPTVGSVVQNRNVDSTGMTYDVTFAEDLDTTSAETTANYTPSNGANVVGATVLANGEVVRVVLDDYLIPGDETLTVDAVTDLAGNAMAAAEIESVTSSDATAPAPLAVSAQALEGGDNDTLLVSFNDDMIEDEVEDPTTWEVESPIGTALDTSNASVVYDSGSRTATLTFDGGGEIDFKGGDDVTVGFASTLRDVGGNSIGPTTVDASIVAESTLPRFDCAWVESAFQNQVHVRFSEPCDLLDDLGGETRYVVRNVGGVVKGSPQIATVDADRLGVELTFGFAVAAASDTLDVLGATDLAGNYLFPALTQPIEAEDATEPELTAATSQFTCVAGEHNDYLEVQFDVPPSPWGLLDAANWTVDDGVDALDLSQATLSRVAPDTVRIDFDQTASDDLQNGTVYTVTVDGVMSAQGVALSSSSSDASAAVGDAASPTMTVGKTRLDPSSPTDTVVIEMSEALNTDDAQDASLIEISGLSADTATMVGPRTVRATWSGGVNLGDIVDVDLRDLAGNVGNVALAVTAADVAGPLVVDFYGVAVPGRGGDYVVVQFDEEVDPTSSSTASNYTLTNGSTAMSLLGAQFRYSSVAHTVTIFLAAGVELDVNASLTIAIDDVEDCSGLPLNPSANVGGPIGGDAQAPDFENAFVNYRESPAGDVVDVLFDEDVDATFAGNSANWVVGSTTVVSVEQVADDQFRLTLAAPLGLGATVELDGLPDLAGNAGNTIQIAPED